MLQTRSKTLQKSISILICLCIVLANTIPSHAAWSDSQALSVVNDVSSIKTTLNNIYSRLGTIMGYLYDDSHSIAYWTSAIASWMSPIYQALTSQLVSNLNLEPIISGLNLVVSNGGTTSYTPYLYYNSKSAANYLYDFNNYFLSSTGRTFSGWVSFNSDTSAGLYSGTIGVSPFATTLITALGYINNNTTRGFNFLYSRGINGYNGQQTATNWGSLGTSVFTPVSTTDGLYKWLSAIQTPVARLSYVLAGDEEIAAREAAAANQDAVVDNFIDSQGTGSVSPSDLGDMASASSGFESNFNTGVSAGSVWNVFDNSHYVWFSQNTKNQLDTTTQTRNGQDYPTPLLDQYYDEILTLFGGVEER